MLRIATFLRVTCGPLIGTRFPFVHIATIISFSTISLTPLPYTIHSNLLPGLDVYPKEGNSNCLRNVGTYLPQHTVVHDINGKVECIKIIVEVSFLFMIYLNMGCRDISVRMVERIPARYTRNICSNPGRGRSSISSTHCQKQMWCSPSLLFRGWWDSLPRVWNNRSTKNTHHHHIALKLRTRGDLPLFLPRMTSWCAQGQLYFYCTLCQ
jgi:hypothetical protein